MCTDQCDDRKCRACGGPLSPTPQAISSLASMGVLLLPGREELEAEGFCSRTCKAKICVDETPAPPAPTGHHDGGADQQPSGHNCLSDNAWRAVVGEPEESEAAALAAASLSPHVDARSAFRGLAETLDVPERLERIETVLIRNPGEYGTGADDVRWLCRELRVVLGADVARAARMDFWRNAFPQPGMK